MDDLRSTPLPELLRQQAKVAPDASFIEVIGEGRSTRAHSLDRALRIAGALQALGVRRGGSVAIFGATSLAAIHAWMGINMAGAVEVMLNPAYKGQVLEHALNTVEAEFLFVERRLLAVLQASETKLPFLREAIVFDAGLRTVGDGSADAAPRTFTRIGLRSYADCIDGQPLAEPVAPMPRDIASIIFTSGTTGPAKAVLMPYAQTSFLSRRTVDMLHLRADDRFYCVNPLFHMAGKFMALQAMLAAGGSIVLDQAFDASRWLERVRTQEATVSLAHGPMLEMINATAPGEGDADHGLSRMLMVPFPRHIAEAFEARFRLRGIECWGMTEINAVCWTSLDEPLRPGVSGRVDSEWYELAVLDPESGEALPTGQIGELAVRPRKPWMIMQGYMNMPAATVEAWRNLWFHSGDAGFVDERGEVHFVDRLGDRIRRRSENISSFDIECAAQGFLGLQECAAVGVPSEFEGDDDLKLCVVASPGAALDPEALLRFLVLRLPHFMVPRYIEVLEALPRTPTNKVQKGVLRSRGVAAAWDRKAAGIDLRQLVAAASPASTSSSH